MLFICFLSSKLISFLALKCDFDFHFGGLESVMSWNL